MAVIDEQRDAALLREARGELGYERWAPPG